MPWLAKERIPQLLREEPALDRAEGLRAESRRQDLTKLYSAGSAYLDWWADRADLAHSITSEAGLGLRPAGEDYYAGVTRALRTKAKELRRTAAQLRTETPVDQR